MIDEALRAFLERGCATIVGTTGPDGAPHAQRGWGFCVVDGTTVRLMLDASDPVLREHLDACGPIAVTAADVRTLRSVQLKGRVREVDDDPTPDDLARCEAHNDELFDDIEATDHYPRQLTERMVPPGYVVAVVEVAELYDQTPGPSAGAKVGDGG
ncbi:MAG: pyridoxamine 5'-phosphate oxidase family protein [Acidimicrobiia bacterium]